MSHDIENLDHNYHGPVAWMAGHSVAANLCMLLCLVGGFIAMQNIKQEVFPDLTLDVVRVTVSYPGASPDEVRKSIVEAIENVVMGIDGVDEVTSSAEEGSATVDVEVLEGADVQKVYQDVKSEVDRIRTFPEDAEDPEVTLLTHRREVLSLVIYGNTSPQVLHELAERTRDELLQRKDITQVEIVGVKALEIKIEIPQENLRRYNLTIDQVAQRIKAAAVEIPGGGLKTRAGEILVRVKERKDYGRQFAVLPIISTPDGSQVKLEDIAKIDDGFNEDSDTQAVYDNKPAVGIDVYSVGEQTPMQISKSVAEFKETLDTQLPPGIRSVILDDKSVVFKQRIDLLVSNGVSGLILVMITLGLFLEIRLAFWVMMGIPVSFMGSMLVMPLLGVTINMMSLFAYIIAIGIVVDDAIVVGENIYHYRQKGKSFYEASILGVGDVAMPVTFSVLTNCVTFLPLYFMPGMMGKVFNMIPLVVITVFLISLLESIFVLPSHLGHQKEWKLRGLFGWIHHRQQDFSHWFTTWINCRYGPFLDKAIHWRYTTLGVGVAILLCTIGYAVSGRMGFALFPKVESDYAYATITLPYGVAFIKTEKISDRLFNAAQKVIKESGHAELVEGIFTVLETNSVTMKITMAQPEIREKIMSTAEFTNRWRQTTGTLLGIENAKFESDRGGPGSGDALTIELSHRDMKVLEKASAELAADLRKYPMVSDIDDGFSPGKEQLDFTIKPEGKSLGLTANEIARQVRSSFYGAEAIRQQRGRNEIKVMVRLPKNERSSEHNVEDLMIRTPDGIEVPLREVANFTRGRAYTTIDRRNGRTIVNVTADVTPQSRAGEIIRSLIQNELPALMAEYPGLAYSFEGKQADQRESLGNLQVGFLLSLLVIYAMLAIPFRSYLQPLIVMVSIPFGIVGAVLGHIIMGYTLSVVSLLGIVALAGVVINDSLVLIELANKLRKDNALRNPAEAIHAAAIGRFRAIILTTLTTFFGLAPIICEQSRQARFLIPMAISLGFGILFATFITLILVPALYVMIEDMKNIYAGFFKRKKSSNVA